MVEDENKNNPENNNDDSAQNNKGENSNANNDSASGNKPTKPDATGQNRSGEEDPLDRAERINAEAKAENDRREKIIEEEKKLMAEQKVYGRGAMSKPQPDPTETDNVEYAKAVERGEIDPFK